MRETTPPQEYICPLTKELIKDPVVSRYGDNFERKAILTWLEKNDYCPVTGNPLRPSCLVSDFALEQKIRSWLHQHNQEAPKDRGDTTEEEDENILHGFAGRISVPPTRYVCPLTKKIMKDPVMCCYGKNFEREAILDYLEENSDVCPITGQPLLPHDLVPNAALKHEIHEWKEHNGDHGEELPPLHVEEVGEPHFDHLTHKAHIGTRGDTAFEKMRAQRAERLKKEGIPEDQQDDDDVKDPFSATSVLDDAKDTPISLGHVF